MITIPQNNSDEAIKKQQAIHQEELDRITNQFLKGLKNNDYATIECQEHMIGYNGCTSYHHLDDTLEVAREFSNKGYFCYYYNGFNNHGVNQRAVRVCKAPMSASERNSFRNWSWQSV